MVSMYGKEGQNLGEVPGLDRCPQKVSSLSCPHTDGKRTRHESKEVRQEGKSQARAFYGLHFFGYFAIHLYLINSGGRGK